MPERSVRPPPRGPLWQAAAERLELDPLPPLGLLDLRLDPRSREALAALGEALDLALPLRPNTLAGEEPLTALWLGPDQWLLVMPPESLERRQSALRAALGAQPAALTDVSAGYAGIRLGGRRVRDLLALGCPLDLHPRAFASGQCAQSLLAKAQVCLWQPPAQAHFHLLVRASLADYLWRWLRAAARQLEHLS